MQKLAREIAVEARDRDPDGSSRPFGLALEDAVAVGNPSSPGGVLGRAQPRQLVLLGRHVLVRLGHGLRFRLWLGLVLRL